MPQVQADGLTHARPSGSLFGAWKADISEQMDGNHGANRQKHRISGVGRSNYSRCLILAATKAQKSKASSRGSHS